MKGLKKAMVSGIPACVAKMSRMLSRTYLPGYTAMPDEDWSTMPPEPSSYPCLTDEPEPVSDKERFHIEISITSATC